MNRRLRLPVTSKEPVAATDLVRGFQFRYKWKDKQWITLEVLDVEHGKVKCTPPSTYLRHRYIKLEDVLTNARKVAQ